MDIKNGKWEKNEEKKLIKLINTGLSQRNIAMKLERTERSVANKIDEIRHRNDVKLPAGPTPWFRQEGLKIGMLDIETTDLDADIGFMLSWCLKIEDGPLYHASITKEEILDGSFDKRITAELLFALERVDIVCTFYGTDFDIKYIRSRSLFHDLNFYSYGSLYHFDLFYAARALFKMHRRNLDSISRFLGIESPTGYKSSLDIRIWSEARYGDHKALKYILDHNKKDVEILEGLWKRCLPYKKWTRKSV